MQRDRVDSRNSRRGWHVTLRSLLAVVILVGAALAWYLRTIQLQARCVAELVGNLAIIEYDDSEWPAFVRDHFNVNCYRSVVSAAVFQPDSDRVLITIGRLRRLRDLSLYGQWVTDAGLFHLRGLGGLQFLTLEETSVSDAGLARLRDLKRLRHLSLRGTNVTNAAVADLMRVLPELTVYR